MLIRSVCSISPLSLWSRFVVLVLTQTDLQGNLRATSLRLPNTQPKTVSSRDIGYQQDDSDEIWARMTAPRCGCLGLNSHDFRHLYRELPHLALAYHSGTTTHGKPFFLRWITCVTQNSLPGTRRPSRGRYLLRHQNVQPRLLFCEEMVPTLLASLSPK